MTAEHTRTGGLWLAKERGLEPESEQPTLHVPEPEEVPMPAHAPLAEVAHFHPTFWQWLMGHSDWRLTMKGLSV
jgi:hypothetical protein